MVSSSILLPDQPGTFDNLIQPFQIEGEDISGRAVRLGTCVDKILSAHDYPEPVANLLGEALSLASLLGSILKFEGTLTIQARGEGIISLLVVDYETPGHLRGYASFDKDQMASIGETPSFKTLMGEGYLAITIDQGQDMERYQGIVELTGSDLSACAEIYFGSSEQTLTTVRLTSERDAQTHFWRAGGIMVQHLPKGEVGGKRLLSEESLDDWDRAVLLMKTVKNEELLSPTLELNQLLFRLFHEDGLLVFDAVSVSTHCRCSREKIESVLAQYSKEELKLMVEDDGMIKANCEFCLKTYEFTP